MLMHHLPPILGPEYRQHPDKEAVFQAWGFQPMEMPGTVARIPETREVPHSIMPELWGKVPYHVIPEMQGKVPHALIPEMWHEVPHALRNAQHFLPVHSAYGDYGVSTSMSHLNQCPHTLPVGMSDMQDEVPASVVKIVEPFRQVGRPSDEVLDIHTSQCIL